MRSALTHINEGLCHHMDVVVSICVALDTLCYGVCESPRVGWPLRATSEEATTKWTYELLVIYLEAG